MWIQFCVWILVLFGLEHSSSVTSNLLRPPRPHQTHTKENYHLKDTLRWKEGKKEKRKKTKTAPNISHKHKSDSEVFPEQKEHSWGCCPKHHHHTVHSSQRGPMQPSCCQKPSELWEHIWLGSTWVPIKKRDLWNPKKTKHLHWKYAE